MFPFPFLVLVVVSFVGTAAVRFLLFLRGVEEGSGEGVGCGGALVGWLFVEGETSIISPSVGVGCTTAGDEEEDDDDEEEDAEDDEEGNRFVRTTWDGVDSCDVVPCSGTCEEKRWPQTLHISASSMCLPPHFVHTRHFPLDVSLAFSSALFSKSSRLDVFPSVSPLSLISIPSGLDVFPSGFPDFVSSLAWPSVVAFPASAGKSCAGTVCFFCFF